MFIGHYAVGLASKKFAPQASLGALIAAPILLDLIWPIFLLLGWEHVSIVPNGNPFLRLQFDSYPISHGLVAVIGWATLFASVYFGMTRYLAGTVVIWIGVVSHWVLDYVVHLPDLPLAASRGGLYGYGLWQHRWITLGVELALLAIAIWIYQMETRPKDKAGMYGFVAFIAVLLLAYAGVIFGPAPPSVKKLAGFTLITWLMIPFAWWFDSHREPAGSESPPA